MAFDTRVRGDQKSAASALSSVNCTAESIFGSFCNTVVCLCASYMIINSWHFQTLSIREEKFKSEKWFCFNATPCKKCKCFYCYCIVVIWEITILSGIFDENKTHFFLHNCLLLGAIGRGGLTKEGEKQGSPLSFLMHQLQSSSAALQGNPPRSVKPPFQLLSLHLFCCTSSDIANFCSEYQSCKMSPI